MSRFTNSLSEEIYTVPFLAKNIHLERGIKSKGNHDFVLSTWESFYSIFDKYFSPNYHISSSSCTHVLLIEQH